MGSNTKTIIEIQINLGLRMTRRPNPRPNELNINFIEPSHKVTKQGTASRMITPHSPTKTSLEDQAQQSHTNNTAIIVRLLLLLDVHEVVHVVVHPGWHRLAELALHLSLGRRFSFALHLASFRWRSGRTSTFGWKPVRTLQVAVPLLSLSSQQGHNSP